MIAAALFYVFAGTLLTSAAMVVGSRNPVHSVLFLILAFFNAAALFLLAGAEFLAMILLIVYVGAVAVLFLFVVMMLDINFAELRGGYQRYLPIGLAVGGVLLAELVMVLGGWKFSPDAATLRFAPRTADLHNTEQLGRLIYTDYIFLFQAAGLVLLVAMIGAIVLTLRDRTLSRRQDVARQIDRSPADSVALVDPVRRAGVAPGDIRRPRAATPEPVDDGGHGGGHH